ncbi:MAG TPA: dihydroorotate dehydrogenase-like protein [Pirellulales bacterium]|jgi:dihydroorotate dehydrogenase (fumarate)|nr:dihydroorotate dehydrogenase-like protein [Pirellulales bacterium]
MNADLTTTYLGLKLRSPIVVSSCPLTAELDVLRRIEDVGAGAAVLPSLFEEQLADEHSAPTWQGFQGASPHQFHELTDYNRGPHTYLRYIEQAKKAVRLPIIASLNGTSLGEWLSTAKRIEQAGADALELNLMLLTVDPDITALEVEDHYVDIVAAVRAETGLPLAVKIGPYFTALPHFVSRLVSAGAQGVVMFNRYLQPDLDVDNGRVVVRLELSTRSELTLTLRWLGILHGRVEASLAASGGVQRGQDVLKAIAAGASVVQVASVLYRDGVQALGELHHDVEAWLNENNVPSIDALRGSLSQLRCSDPAAFARANYTRAISCFSEAST